MACLTDQRWQRTLRRHFDRAASTYAGHAGVQRQSADAWLARWQTADAPTGRVLDLGCGSGYLACALASWPDVEHLLAVDLSEGMLRGPDWRPSPVLTRLCADASALPLATASIDVAISHFALHWCPSPTQVFAELRRVLRPDGVAQVVIPVAGSLPGRVDAPPDDETLRPLSVWREAVASAGWQVVAEEVVTQGEYHADARAWLTALRAMGVTARRDAPAGLSGRARLQALLRRLEALREPEGIPLRYQLWQARLTPVPHGLMILSEARRNEPCPHFS